MKEDVKGRKVKKSAAPGTRGRKKKGEGARIFLSVVLLCVLIGIVVFSLSMFFYVREIEVRGNERYSTEEILSVVDVEGGENMFKVKTSDIRRAIEENFHYIKNVRVQKRFPSTILISLGETKVECCMRILDRFFFLDRDLKILEITSAEGEISLPFVNGIGYNEEKAGEYLHEENKTKKDALAEIINSLTEHGLLERVDKINILDEYSIALLYEGRIEVLLGNYTQIKEKLDFFNAIKERIHESDSGVLNISNPKRATFNSKAFSWGESY